MYYFIDISFLSLFVIAFFLEEDEKRIQFSIIILYTKAFYGFFFKDVHLSILIRIKFLKISISHPQSKLKYKNERLILVIFFVNHNLHQNVQGNVSVISLSSY